MKATIGVLYLLPDFLPLWFTIASGGIQITKGRINRLVTYLLKTANPFGNGILGIEEEYAKKRVWGNRLKIEFWSQV
jgi:hypothetical protein